MLADTSIRGAEDDSRCPLLDFPEIRTEELSVTKTSESPDFLAVRGHRWGFFSMTTLSECLGFLRALRGSLAVLTAGQSSLSSYTPTTTIR